MELTLRFFGGGLAGSLVVGLTAAVSDGVPGTASVKAGGEDAAATRSSILMVCGGGVGGSSMMVGWLSMFEMSKSMSSMVACRHARDGHALMEVLVSGGWRRGYLSVRWKRASVAFMEPGPHYDTKGGRCHSSTPCRIEPADTQEIGQASCS